MSNVLAAIGCGQLEVLTERVNKRRKVYETYAKAFEGIAGIRFQPELAFSFSNRWLTVCLFHEDVFPENFAANLVEALNKVQIEARRLWKPLHQQPVFKSVPFMSNGVSDQLFASGICLPSGSAMTEDDIQRVIETTLNFVHQAN